MSKHGKTVLRYKIRYLTTPLPPQAANFGVKDLFLKTIRYTTKSSLTKLWTIIVLVREDIVCYNSAHKGGVQFTTIFE